jgi:hypothetical protein
VTSNKDNLNLNVTLHCSYKQDVTVVSLIGESAEAKYFSLEMYISATQLTRYKIIKLMTSNR